MERKQAIRKELLKKRNSLTEEQCEKYSKLIAERFVSLDSYIMADSLLIYASYLTEVSTYGIIKNALNTGKTVFCPKVTEPGTMEFYEIFSLEELVFGYKNIPEPGNTHFPYSGQNPDRTLMVMPLVGFDVHKNRLGYGGGFYDRYLQRFPQISRIALSFECQKYDLVLPIEETDQKPDFIITEQMVY